MAFTAHVLAVAVVVVTLGFDFLESESGGYHEQQEQIRSRGLNVTSSECGNTERSTKNPVKEFAAFFFFFLEWIRFFFLQRKTSDTRSRDRLSILSKCADGYRHSISVHGSVKKTTISLCCPVTEASYAIHGTHARQFLILNVTCAEN